jgi:hypothetical protein
MNKLNIRLSNGSWLDVPDDTIMKFTLENNMFFDNARRREHSMSISLPLTSTNNRELGWLNQIGTSNSANTEFQCALFNGSTYLMSADLIVHKTMDNYMVNITTGYGSFDVIVGDVTIRELDLTWPSFSTDLVDINAGSWPAYPYACPEFCGIIAGSWGRSPNVGLQQADSLWGGHLYSGNPFVWPYVNTVLDRFGAKHASHRYERSPISCIRPDRFYFSRHESI